MKTRCELSTNSISFGPSLSKISSAMLSTGWRMLSSQIPSISARGDGSIEMIFVESL